METIYVGLLTLEQKDLLVGQEFDTDSYFGPIQDANDNWIISQTEINLCINENFMWVKLLPLVEYKIKIMDI